MEKPRLLVAVMISIGILILWNYFFAPKKPTEVQTPVVQQQAGNSTISPAPPELKKQEPQKYEYKVTEMNKGPYDIELGSNLGDVKKFNVSVKLPHDTQSQVIDFVQTFGLKTFNKIVVGNTPVEGSWTKENDDFVFRGKNNFGEVVQRITLNDNYTWTVHNDVKILDPNLKFIFVEGEFEFPKHASGGFFAQSAYDDFIKGIYYSKNEVDTLSSQSKFADNYEGRSNIEWFGIYSRYFAMLMDFSMPGVQDLGFIGKASAAGGIGKIQSGVVVQGKNNISFSYSGFFGPKSLELLKATNKTYSETLEYGWFSFISIPLVECMKIFYNFAKNYGVAIILLTIMLKLATFPLAYMGSKSMKKMSKINPILQEIRAKYKDDPMKMQQETMKTFREHKANPYGSCLIAFVQIPIFWGLFRALSNSIELYGAPFGLWIHNLTAKDPFFVLPILVGGMMFLQFQMTPSPSTDPVQKKVMSFMPLMMTIFMLSMPAGLSLYSFVNATISIIQQWYFNKKFA